jgi:hypothetical protein
MINELKIFNAFHATLSPTTLNHDLFIQQKHCNNVQGIIGKYGRMWSIMKTCGRGGNKIPLG